MCFPVESGSIVGKVGTFVGFKVGLEVGRMVGDEVGEGVGEGEGEEEGIYVGVVGLHLASPCLSPVVASFCKYLQVFKDIIN